MAGKVTPKTMDARKFVRALNNSAQSKIAVFEDRVRSLGKVAKRNYSLVGLYTESLIFEDVDTNQYYEADIKKHKGRVEITNVKPITVVEEEKPQIFEQSCLDIVDALTEDDYKKAEKAFNIIESQRFRSRVIPTNGVITTRDGVAHRVRVEGAKQESLPLGDRLSKILAETLSDDIEIGKDGVIRGVFQESQHSIEIPVDEFTRRRAVARFMRNSALDAHKSKAFREFVGTVAGHISEGKVQDAVQLASKFLREEQEFCLLNYNQVKTLVEDALAAVGYFDEVLSEHTAVTLFRTNMNVNRNDLTETWEKVALMSENASLLNSVELLKESDDFEGEYQKFLESVFTEDQDVTNQKAKAFHNCLTMFLAVLDELEKPEYEDTRNELREKLSRLERAMESGSLGADDAIVVEVEEALAGIDGDLISTVKNLSNFDQMSEPAGREEEGEEEEDEDMVPMPELEGEEEGEEDELGLDLGELEGEGGEEEEEEELPALESLQTKVVPIDSMTIADLAEELESWRTNGSSYLAEDGINDCLGQMNAFVKRCLNLGPQADALREEFETMRTAITYTGDDVTLEHVNDPYISHLKDLPQASISRTYSEDMKAGYVSQPSGSHGRSYKDGESSMSDEHQGSGGVADKKLQSMDHKTSSADGVLSQPKGAHGRNYGSGQTGMADEREGDAVGGKKKHVSGSGVKGDGAKNADSDATLKSQKGSLGRDYGSGKTTMGDEHQDTSYFGKGTSAGSVKEGRHEGEIDQPRGSHGRDYSDHELGMGDEHQDGTQGVAQKSATASDGRGAGGENASMQRVLDGEGITKSQGSLADKGLRMDDQQGEGGVAKKAAKPDGTRQGSDVAEDIQNILNSMDEVFAEGEVPEAFKKQWNGGKDKKDDDEKDDKEDKDDKAKDDDGGEDKEGEDLSEAQYLYGTHVNEKQRAQVTKGRVAYTDDQVSEDISKIADSMAEDVALIYTSDEGGQAGQELESVVAATVKAMAAKGGGAPEGGVAVAEEGDEVDVEMEIDDDDILDDEVLAGKDEEEADEAAEEAEEEAEEAAEEAAEEELESDEEAEEEEEGETFAESLNRSLALHESDVESAESRDFVFPPSKDDEGRYCIASVNDARLALESVSGLLTEASWMTGRHLAVEDVQEKVRAKVRSRFPDLTVDRKIKPTLSGRPINEYVTLKGRLKKTIKQ